MTHIKSKFMSNNQQVEVEKNDEPYFKQNRDKEMKKCISHLVGARL
jgi:hypothetical protein